MEATSNKPSLLLSKYFQVIHLCLSIAVVFAMVHNQLVNDGRFKKLEHEVYRQENANTVREIFPQKKNLESLHKVIKRNVPMGINKDIKKSTRDSRKEKVIDKSKRDVLACLDVLRTFANRSRTNVELNICKPFRGLPGQPGTKGTRGKRGKQGKRGLQGQKGKIGKEGSMGKHGPAGPRGEKGFSGKQGKRGLQGKKGKIGKEGSMGKHGPPGPRGEKGFRGPQGERGEKGCSGTFFADPLFRRYPQRLVFNEGNVAVLTCTAVANPSAQITWYRDNMLINEQRDSTSYTIENRDVTPQASARAKYCPSEIPHPVVQSTFIINKSNGSDTGTYSCMARNILGTTSFNIDILVQVHVQLTAIPSNITVVQGEYVLLSCRASGVPRPTTTWYRKDDAPMPAQHSVAMGDLRIKNISKEEEGTFVCLVINVLGSKTTEATVTVNVFPEITSFVNHVITVNESNNLVLPCNATGYPLPELQWTKRNDSLPAGRYYFDSQVLNITNVTYEDGGEYICTANNTVGLVNRSVHVLVQVAPKPLLKPKVTEFGYRGHDTILNFIVLAYPPATIKWTKYGKVLQTLNQSNSSLTLTNVQYKDSGLYQAVARNILGEVRVTTFLIVRDPVPASVMSFLSKQKVQVGCFEDLPERICTAVGNPAPNIVWKHNGVTLMSTTGTSLTLNITNVNMTHAGRYTCEASNIFGSTRQYFDLDILCILVETECNYTRINSNSGRIMSPNYPGNYANSKKCSWKLTSSLNAKLVLLFEQFNTEGTYDKVKVYNGGSASSSSLGVFSGTSVPSPITSMSHQLYITFNTDASGPRPGFSIKFQETRP